MNSISQNMYQTLSWPNFQSISNQLAISAFRSASYLTDMPCNAHQCEKLAQIVDELYPTASKIEKWARKAFFTVGMVCYGAATLFTGLPGIALREIGIYLQTNPWIEEHGTSPGKVVSGGVSFSTFFWNICGPGGGFAITDGGVMPLWNRMDSVIEKIIEKNADVNCLCEVWDIEHALYIAQKLKEKGYTDFYYNIQPLSIGVSSGLFVASKYVLKNPEFIRFPEETLVGRTKNAAKGVFFFDLTAQGKTFATGCTTHMQHSEECEFPTEEEVLARNAQMKIIKEKIKTIAKDRVVFLQGDLNGIPEELKDQDPEWDAIFETGNLFKEIKTTWGGDAFCAKLVGKKASSPLFYDYSMIRKGDPAMITTFKVSAEFDGKKFNKNSYSDHDGLWSLVQC